MKRTLLFGTIFSSAIALGAAAQTPAGSSPAQQDSPQPVTVTGCLQQAEATDSASAGSSSRGYVLDNAKIGATAGTTGTPGTTTPTGSSAGEPGATGAMAVGMNKIKLEGGDQADMQKYANSQVEVRGKLEPKGGASSPSSAMPSNPASNPTGSGTAGSTGSAAGGYPSQSGTARPNAAGQDMPTLRVDSIRQLSASCEAK